MRTHEKALRQPWEAMGFAGSWNGQDGPRRLQEGLRESKMASEMAQDNARSFKMVSKMPQEAPRPPQDGPKLPNKLPKEPPQEVKIRAKPKENQCLLLSRLVASDGIPRPQGSSKRDHEGPKRGPREHHDGLKSAQERSKVAPRGAQEATRGTLEGRC